MRWHLSPPISVYQIHGEHFYYDQTRKEQEHTHFCAASPTGAKVHTPCMHKFFFRNRTLTSTLPPRPWLRTVTPIHCPSLISSLPGGSNVLESMSARAKKKTQNQSRHNANTLDRVQHSHARKILKHSARKNEKQLNILKITKTHSALFEQTTFGRRELF